MRENDGSIRWQRERMISQSCPTCDGEDLRGIIKSLRIETERLRAALAKISDPLLLPVEGVGLSRALAIIEAQRGIALAAINPV